MVIHGDYLDQYLLECKEVERIRFGERAVHVEQNSANFGRDRKRIRMNLSRGNKENEEDDGVSDARIIIQAVFKTLYAMKIQINRKQSCL